MYKLGTIEIDGENCDLYFKGTKERWNSLIRAMDEKHEDDEEGENKTMRIQTVAYYFEPEGDTHMIRYYEGLGYRILYNLTTCRDGLARPVCKGAFFETQAEAETMMKKHRSKAVKA